MDSQKPVATSADEQESFLSRVDWLQAAIRLLIDEGVDQVKIQRLSKRLGASRGSFYWHFRDRDELLNEVLRHWQHSNTEQLIAALGSPDDPLEVRLLGLFDLWLSQHPFYPRFDNAIRAWAAKSPKVRRIQRRADQRRRRHIEQMFLDAGYPSQEAEVRGDILYFTQVGYYLLDLGETRKQRMTKMEAYYLAFTGRHLPAAAARRFRSKDHSPRGSTPHERK